MESRENVWILHRLQQLLENMYLSETVHTSNMNLTLIDDWKITIGKNVLIGPNVTLCTTGHPIDVGRILRTFKIKRMWR